MRDTFELSNSRVYQAYAAGQLEAGLKMAEALLARNRVRFGEKHANTVIARGILAIGFSRSGNDDLAKREFKEVIPQLLTDLRVDEAADTDVAAADRRRAREAIAEAISRRLHARSPASPKLARPLSWPIWCVLSRSIGRLQRPAPGCWHATRAWRSKYEKSKIWPNRSAHRLACSAASWRCPTQSEMNRSRAL